MKVVVEFDTVTKKMSVTKDGNIMPAMYSACFYKQYDKEDEYYMTLDQEAKSKEDGTTIRVSTYATSIAKLLGYKDEN